MRGLLAGAAALSLLTAAALDLGTRTPSPPRERSEAARVREAGAAVASRMPEAPPTSASAPSEPPVAGPDAPDPLEARVQALLVGGSDVETISALAEAYGELAAAKSPLAGPVRWTLQSALLDASEEVRAAAILGLLCETSRHRALFAVTFDTEPSPAVRAELVRPLATTPGFLRAQVRGERDASVRRFAAEMCRIALLPEDAGWLQELAASEPDPEVRLAIRDSVRVLTSR